MTTSWLFKKKNRLPLHPAQPCLPEGWVYKDAVFRHFQIQESIWKRLKSLAKLFSAEDVTWLPKAITDHQVLHPNWSILTGCRVYGPDHSIIPQALSWFNKMIRKKPGRCSISVRRPLSPSTLPSKDNEHHPTPKPLSSTFTNKQQTKPKRKHLSANEPKPRIQILDVSPQF